MHHGKPDFWFRVHKYARSAFFSCFVLFGLTLMLSPSETVMTFPFNDAWSLNIDLGMSGTVLKVGVTAEAEEKPSIPIVRFNNRKKSIPEKQTQKKTKTRGGQAEGHSGWVQSWNGRGTTARTAGGLDALVQLETVDRVPRSPGRTLHTHAFGSSISIATDLRGHTRTKTRLAFPLGVQEEKMSTRENKTGTNPARCLLAQNTLTCTGGSWPTRAS